ncbi:chloramphenicol-sensitive protein RarD [Clostridiales Family XIII bacterium PM5-7]
MNNLKTQNEKNTYRIGLISVLSCNLIWGFLPIYWKALEPIDSFVIIFYRIVLMAIVCFFACGVKYQFNLKSIFAPMFETRKKTMTYIIAGVVISLNWSLYIWAVNAGFVIQTCVGYFIEPLLVCVFGMIFYKEKANKWKKIALGFAVAGLAVMIIGYGELPMIALGLACSFAIYSAIKKSVFISPLQSLLYETLFLAPIALLFVFYFEGSGAGALAVGGGLKFFLLLFAGLATAIPLGLFSFGANKLSLITLGVSEYISPSITLILGIFLFKEPFDIIQFSSFAVIWVGLIFFTYGEIKDVKSGHVGGA